MTINDQCVSNLDQFVSGQNDISKFIYSRNYCQHVFLFKNNILHMNLITICYGEE